MKSNDMNEENKIRNSLFSKEWLGVVGALLVLAQLVLVIVSWLLSATRLEGVRSLLSSEGIRWFIGDFSSIIASPLLAWLLLILIALGALQKSGAVSLFAIRYSLFTYRDRVALRVALAFLIIYIVIIGLLTLLPHAILLSATGSLFPSAFSRSLLPIIALGICFTSIAFGVVVGRLRSLSDVLNAMSYGIVQGAPMMIIYLLAIQLYASLRFVFG
jgi:aminobenzoyl-glutamate transport protein